MSSEIVFICLVLYIVGGILLSFAIRIDNAEIGRRNANQNPPLFSQDGIDAEKKYKRILFRFYIFAGVLCSLMMLLYMIIVDPSC